MEQPSESEALNGDTQSPRSSGVHDDLVATTAADGDNAVAGQVITSAAAATATADAAAAPATDADASSGTFTPPYWRSLERTNSAASDVSITNLRPPPIQLEDHSDECHEVGRACWAKHVSIDDYVVVGGGAIAGAYVVWNCTVETLKGAPFTIRKRYSEFDSLRENLVRAYPHSAASIPELPRKSVISRFRPKFLEQRRAGLSHFLNCVLLNPEFSGSPLVKDFVFA